MAQPIAKKYTSELKRLKANVEMSRQYFQENYDRFNEFRKFVFETTLSDDDITNLQDIQKPILEFNILEPYISRLCGEFSKQEPQIEVFASHDTPFPVDVQTVNVVDGIFRIIMDEAKKEGDTYEVFKDLMSGGFSVFEVYTDYENEMSFNQNFKVRRVFDPTLCGFDPMAGQCHKGDGNYAYKLYPKYADDLMDEYPDIDFKDMAFLKSNSGFNWSFKDNQSEKIALLCDYYERQNKTEKIVRLANDMVLTAKQYKKMLAMFEERGIIAVPPKIVEERYTQFPTIHRYTFIENQLLCHEETDFKFLPLVFVDGNSIKLRQGKNGDMRQMTRPYLYHARDIQRLKNFAGQTLANELENMIQHKFKVAEESIPPEYKDAYDDVQHADVLIYKAYDDKNPDKPIPPPQEIVRTPIPPEVTNTFSLTDQMTQNILGSFDIQMGNLNKSQISGLAIQESVTQSNAVAMPYVVGYLQAWAQLGKIIIDLIPKYFVTPRTVPVLSSEGKRSFVKINDQNDPRSPQLDYYDNALHINVEPGVNFTIQKTRALQQIAALMQTSPLFAQFMNTEGLPILLDNIEIRGIDQLKLMAETFVQKIQMQQAKASQMPNPAMLKFQQEQQKIAMQQQQNQVDNQMRAAEIANDSEANQIDKAKVILQAQEQDSNNMVQLSKANAEEYSKAVDIALKVGDQQHRHTKEAVELAHTIISSQQPTGENQNAQI